MKLQISPRIASPPCFNMILRLLALTGGQTGQPLCEVRLPDKLYNAVNTNRIAADLIDENISGVHVL